MPNTARAVTSLNGLEDEIAGVIKGQLELDDDVDPTASFVEDLGADSLDAVELIMTLEEEFDIEIPEEDVVSITNIETAVKYITEKKGE